MRLRLAPASAAALMAAGLTACGTTAADKPDPHVLAAVTPTEQFAVELASVPEEILLAPNGTLSAAQSAALGELAARWREVGESPIVVEATSGSGGSTAQAAAQALQAFGVPGDAVQLKPAPEGDAPAAPVRVGFIRTAAVGPNCAGMWSEFARTSQNMPHSSFGCATTANFAAQLADPRDLSRPRPMTSADADRRGVVLDKYRKGEPTASEREQDERGVVSRKIQ